MAEERHSGSQPRGARGRAPWHLWAAGAFMLALYLGGAWDYLNLLEPRTDYIEGQGWGAAAADYFTDYPLPTRVLWTVNIAAGLLAPVLLFLRSRHAVAAALTAALSQLLLMAVTLTLMDRWAALGPATNLWDAGVALVTAAFWWYCLLLRRRSLI